jgi:protein regulator of cytokinesis 1
MPAAMDTGYLTTQVTTIIGQLHSIFDEIGVPRNERDARETEVLEAQLVSVERERERLITS